MNCPGKVYVLEIQCRMKLLFDLHSLESETERTEAAMVLGDASPGPSNSNDNLYSQYNQLCILIKTAADIRMNWSKIPSVTLQTTDNSNILDLTDWLNNELRTLNLDNAIIGVSRKLCAIGEGSGPISAMAVTALKQYEVVLPEYASKVIKTFSTWHQLMAVGAKTDRSHSVVDLASISSAANLTQKDEGLCWLNEPKVKSTCQNILGHYTKALVGYIEKINLKPVAIYEELLNTYARSPPIAEAVRTWDFRDCSWFGEKVSKKLLFDLGELEKAIEKNELDAVQRN